MLSVPDINKGKYSMINAQEAMPTFIYEPEMTLEDYIQGKNVQRRLEYKLLNIQYGGSNPLNEEKEYYFEKQLHDIKGFVMHIIGEGSLYNKFTTMIDNLYLSFMKEITIYHQLKVQRETEIKDARFGEFKKSNEKIVEYLKKVENEHKDIDEKLEHLKKTKELYKLQRENELKERLEKEKEKEEELKKKIEKEILENKEKLQLALNEEKKVQEKANIVEASEAKKKVEVKKTQKELELYNKRRETIGKLSNVFASFIHE